MQRMLSKKEVNRFRSTIWRYYQTNRRDFPWRKTTNPYRVLVSEIMLQQTQADRVVGKYKSFLKRFPTFRALTSAPLGEVLAEWQGLGYNRRAKMLHALSHVIVKNYKGKLPTDESELVSLPGIGKATAVAVRAFAFNLPGIYLETNVRSVYLHYFFKDQKNVSDSDLVPLIEQTMDVLRPREWSWAILDYGVMVKKKFGNPSRSSKHYSKQSAFNGSLRQVRGSIVKLLIEQKTLSLKSTYKLLPFNSEQIDAALVGLIEEGLLIKKHQSIYLP